MAEPQPSDIHEGATDPHAPTGSAEDRKATAALSSLDTQEDSAEKKEVDGKALNKAMQGLNVKDQKSWEGIAVKVEPADVALLVRAEPVARAHTVRKTNESNMLQVSELELSKQKATELLRNNGGDAVKAMTAFVRAEA